jgi:EAL domain-containing protein (putative c-di-GMP-specific phosphodiesterase class I)
MLACLGFIRIQGYLLSNPLPEPQLARRLGRKGPAENPTSSLTGP